MAPDDLLARQAREGGDLVEILAVVDDGYLQRLGVARHVAGQAQSREARRQTAEVGGVVRHHQDGPFPGDDVHDTGQRDASEGGVHPVGGRQIPGLHEQGGVADPPHLHAKDSRVTPASESADRTDLARTTAPGVSPCTHMERAFNVTSVPSTATTDPSTAIRTARCTTVSGSWTTAPGSRRDTSAPDGV